MKIKTHKVLKKFIFLLFFAFFVLFSLAYAQDNNSSIRLLFAGDVMLDRYVKKRVDEKFNGDYGKIFEKISNYLNSFDYVSVNLEGPISNKGKKVGSIYSFRMTPEVLTFLQKVNIKIFNLANNHIWDYGKVAFRDTLINLKNNGFFYYGAGENSDKAFAPLILTKSGMRIGILGFSDFLSYLEAKENQPGLAVVSSKSFQSSIKEAKKRADVLIVTFHWGNEYQHEPSDRQRKIARQAIDLGADLIVGHHPHIVQKIEKYKDKFIFYSLGNFVFDQNFSQDTMKGGLVEIEIENKKMKNVHFRWIYLNKYFQIGKISEKLLPFELEGKIYKLRIADNSQEWERGLMFVEKPVDYDGMIFVFPDKKIRYFWNKNTLVDLDVYWLDDDKIMDKNLLPSIKKTKEIYSIKSPQPVNKVIEIIK